MVIAKVHTMNNHRSLTLVLTTEKSIHILWLFPQYFVITVEEIMFSVTGRNQFVRFETETEQVQSQQARPRLKRYSLTKRDRDYYLQIFMTETESRKMCIFGTETRKMVETKTETESLADLIVASIYNLNQT